MSIQGFSSMYLFVRSRQLEGTFPGDPYTGNWPISTSRILRGWGVPPEEAWPYNGDASAWPPVEPPGMDLAAKSYRIGCYQRVRTVTECKIVLGVKQFPVGVSLDITDKWASAPGGRIPVPSVGDVVTGTHSVLLHGYDDSDREFKFQNSWGEHWGDHGYGYISYETFEATWWEGWLEDLTGNRVPIESQPVSEPQRGIIGRAWGVAEHGGGLFHCIELVDPNEERIAWTFAVEREGIIEVEEFFVRPQFRRKGYGTQLLRWVRKLGASRGGHLKVWIPYPDAESGNLPLVEKLARQLNLRIKHSDVRFAPLVATSEIDSTPSELRPLLIPCSRPRAPFRPYGIIGPGSRYATMQFGFMKNRGQKTGDRRDVFVQMEEMAGIGTTGASR